jgi:hypothetical protein
MLARNVGVSKMNITKAQFMKYVKVQLSGKYNMRTDADRAAKAAGLSEDVYWAIIKQYNKLSEKWLNKECS